jgi:hypothetical protein
MLTVSPTAGINSWGGSGNPRICSCWSVLHAFNPSCLTLHCPASVLLLSCSGFYVDRDINSWGGTGHPRICLVVQAAREQAGAVEKFRVRRPNNGWLRLELTMREVRL